jgi:hypothetical protein
MTLKKQVSISLTADEKAALDNLAESHGYPSTSGMIAAIATGQISLGVSGTMRLHGEVEAIWLAIEDLRRQLATAPPLGPTDMP